MLRREQRSRLVLCLEIWRDPAPTEAAAEAAGKRAVDLAGLPGTVAIHDLVDDGPADDRHFPGGTGSYCADGDLDYVELHRRLIFGCALFVDCLTGRSSVDRSPKKRVHRVAVGYAGK